MIFCIYTIFMYNKHNVSIIGTHFLWLVVYFTANNKGTPLPWHLSQTKLTCDPGWLFINTQYNVLVTVRIIRPTHAWFLVGLIWLGNFQVHLPSAFLLVCPFLTWLGFILLYTKSNLAHIALKYVSSRVFSWCLDNSNWNNYL